LTAQLMFDHYRSYSCSQCTVCVHFVDEAQREFVGCIPNDSALFRWLSKNINFSLPHHRDVCGTNSELRRPISRIFALKQAPLPVKMFLPFLQRRQRTPQTVSRLEPANEPIFMSQLVMLNHSDVGRDLSGTTHQNGMCLSYSPCQSDISSPSTGDIVR
jgi:hypothetical protein